MDDDFHYLVFPQTDGRARLYGAWDIADKHRYSGDGRERRFLESFRLPCFPVPDVIADATPAGPLAGYPMTDTWTDEVAADGVVLIGDSAGWSDPIIGQGMSVTFRDAEPGHRRDQRPPTTGRRRPSSRTATSGASGCAACGMRVRTAT